MNTKTITTTNKIKDIFIFIVNIIMITCALQFGMLYDLKDIAVLLKNLF